MKVIGHRGARGLAPENTLASFEAALAAGVDEVELDVRVTKDGIPVLNHDPFLHDASGSKLRHVLVHERTLHELRHYRPDLATLEEAVVRIDRQVPIVVEVKPGVSVGEPIATLKHFLSRGWQPSDFLVASFSQRTLRALHEALPDVEPVVLEHLSGLNASLRAKQVGARRVAFNHHIIWWWFIRSMARSGYHVVTHTLNNPKKAERWLKYGLYGVVTDYPDRFIYQSEIAKGSASTTPTQSPPQVTARPQKRRTGSKLKRPRRSK
jgi:glycerophosphoryl diester phosphodiesterase